MNFQERKKQVKSYLGKTVEIEIDRPIGSIHPKHADIIYPINYGYIPNVFGGDGEELDVYLLGVDAAVERYVCNVIGIIHRENDVEDKLVAAPSCMKFNQAEIAEMVNFQEQYYKTTVEAIYQKSCGVVVYRMIEGQPEYLLLMQKQSGTWSVPKGHMERGETERETAVREVFEETGAVVELKNEFRAETNYKIFENKEKNVVLFLAEFDGDIKIDFKEITEYVWAKHDKAKKLLPELYKDVIESIEAELNMTK